MADFSSSEQLFQQSKKLLFSFGFKNSTDGSLQAAVDAMRTALNDLEIDRIKALPKTISAGQTLDPQALQTYKTLGLRLKELQRLRAEAIL